MGSPDPVLTHACKIIRQLIYMSTFINAQVHAHLQPSVQQRAACLVRSMSDLKRLAFVVEHADLHLNVLASCLIASLKLTTVQGQIEVIAYVA